MKKNLDDISRDLIGILSENGEGDPQSIIYREMMLNIGLIREEKFDTGELKLLHTAFKELRYALSVFRKYRGVRKAAVFGSARTPKHHHDFKMAESFGRGLAKAGWMLITGGASGIMEAAMVGAGARHCFGLNILLPFEQEANAIIKNNPKLMFFKYFFTRKLMFLKESDATVLFPGGFGTFDEGFESFTLVQTGKAKPRPLVLVDPRGSTFWSSTLEVLRKNMEDGGLISPGDLELMRHFQDPESAVNEITEFYGNYHSSRFLKDAYLIRVRRHLDAKKLKRLNIEFADICVRGKFEKLKDLSLDDDKDPKLERIVFYFDRSGYGRLRKLIDVLNSF